MKKIVEEIISWAGLVFFVLFEVFVFSGAMNSFQLLSWKNSLNMVTINYKRGEMKTSDFKEVRTTKFYIIEQTYYPEGAE